LREVYYKLRVPSDLLLLCASGALCSAGQWAIEVMFDARYSGAGHIVQVLALSLIITRYLVAHQIYLAVGIPKYLTAINIVRFVSLYSVVPLCYVLGGTEGAIWAIATYGAATVPLVYAFNAQLRLNDWQRELTVLLAFPGGYVLGLMLRAFPKW